MKKKKASNLLPSGENATLLTELVWPLNSSPIYYPDSTSHSRIVLSKLALANLY